MKTLSTCALAVLLLSSSAASAGEKKEGIQVSFSSDDSRTRLAPRHDARNTRLAIKTRSGAAMLLLTNDVVAVQLSDAKLAAAEPKEDANLLEEILVAGVLRAVGKSVEYPIANIRSAEIRDGVLVLTSDRGKPVFHEVKVDGQYVTHDLTTADAARFVNAFRAAKAKR